MEEFFILNGNHTKTLTNAVREGGFDAILAYFAEHKNEVSRFSDKFEVMGKEEG